MAENLTKKELKELIGGSCTQMLQQFKSSDNINETAGCICNYDNDSLTNSNAAVGCRCNCR
ncbi:MAG: hypothetical protein LBE91_02740 [Tannerella sp.]|jgi:hypothetical protein|nr:hypothetical protein [Tannerella sp.]